MIGTKVTAKALQLVQATRALECLGVQFHGTMGREDTGAPTARFLGVGGVRCGIGAGKELGIARRGGLEECLAVRLAFEDGEAVEVRFDPADQQGVAVVQQMMARDGRTDVGGCRIDVVDSLLGGNVLHDNLEGGKIGHQGLHNLLDELPLPIKNVDRWTRHLGMDAQDHAHLGHGPQRGIRLFDVRHAKLRVGRGTGWIVLACLDVSRGVGLADLFRRCHVG